MRKHDIRVLPHIVNQYLLVLISETGYHLMALDSVVCTQYRKIRNDIVNALDSGAWKTLRIEIEGDVVQNTTIPELMKFLTRVEGIIASCDNLSELANSQNGLRTVAVNAGDGLF